jgi:MFS family permease
MRGLEPSSEWTHLIPGFIVAGLGSGLVNPPLASTAIGVVKPQVAGMASGINSTFRQIGIATSVAALGSILATREAGTTGAAHAAAFVSGLDELFLISGLIALSTGALAMLLIRQRDFVTDALEPVSEAHASPQPVAAGCPARDGRGQETSNERSAA